MANLYALLAIYVFATAMKNADWRLQFTLIVVGVGLAFSHFSSVMLISFVWVFSPIVYVFFKGMWRAYVTSSLSLSLGLFSLLLYHPNLI